MKNDDKMKVLYDEETFVVIEKISGFLSVPGRGEDKFDSVASRVCAMYEGCITQPAVHRLDMDTSGLLVLAKTKEVHRALSIQFQDRKVSKKYIALIEGVLEEDSGEIELPFRLDVDNRPHQIYDPVHGKMGLTRWERIGVEGDFTRVAFYPHTGRTHQLRVHSAHKLGLGFPIVGDPLYGRVNGHGQLMLHATELGFQHPETAVQMTFNSEVPF
ncbi:MAG: RluA family pseudouridine synthase [Lentisphaeraceae bacterium]|nr:RluA family pseudouridine synthase [Lentisphaeraceae bacterium]